MKSLSTYLLCGTFLALSLGSILDLRASLLASSAVRGITNNGDADFPGGKRIASPMERVSALRRASEVPFARLQPSLKLAEISLEEAGRTSPGENSFALYCASLSSMGRALQSEPFNGRYLINWANIRQLLGSYHCVEPFTDGQSASVLELALTMNPHDPSVLYSAGLISLWAQRRHDALRYFGKVVRFGMSIPAGQLRTMLGAVETAEDLIALVPSRFPQVDQWTRLIMEERPDDYRTFRHTLSALQVKAVEETHFEYVRGDIPQSLHIDRLMGLLRLNPEARVRKQVDHELSQSLGSGAPHEVVEYLSARAKFDDVAIIRSALSGDTRPEKTPLTVWNSNARIVFDGFFETVGFYAPPSQTVRIIQLMGEGGGKAPMPDQVKVFVSDDNQSWVELTDSIKMERFLLQTAPLLTIRTDGKGARYWKVLFASNQRTRLFGAPLSQFLTAYGYAGDAR